LWLNHSILHLHQSPIEMQTNIKSAVPQQYGSFESFANVYSDEVDAPDETSDPALLLLKRRRNRVNMTPVIAAVLVPSALFAATFACMSFSMHYNKPVMTFLCVCTGFVVIALIGMATLQSVTAPNASSRETTWLPFYFVTLLLAWTVAVVVGDLNFTSNMEPFYSFESLNFYPDVDPLAASGQTLMDAGRMLFTPNSRLDLTKSMGFKKEDVYCVAPVSTARASVVNGSRGGSLQTPENYDFWAVGMNCCSGNGPDFRCGHFNDPKARGGLRLMEDDQRAFFRLAVQQAEATYNIRAAHPIFLRWLPDPLGEAQANQQQGFQRYLQGVLTFLSVQCFLVAAATLTFAKPPSQQLSQLDNSAESEPVL